MITTLKQLRESRGMSQQALSGYLDVSDSYLARMEKGEAPMRHAHARAAATALKCSESALMQTHAAEVDFTQLDSVLVALKGAELAEVMATPRGRRMVQEFVHRCLKLGDNDALSPALKRQAEDNAEIIVNAVSKATTAAATLIATKRSEDRDVAIKAADNDDDRPYRDSFGRVRTDASIKRDGFGKVKRSDNHVPSHKRSSVPRSSDFLPRAAESMASLGRDQFGRVVKETEEDGETGFSQRGRRAQRAAEAKTQATKSAQRATKNFVKGSMDWVRQSIEKQLDTDASGQRAYSVRVLELFADHAIVETAGEDEVKSYPWTYKDGADAVELGEASEVELEYDYSAAATEES